MCVHRFALLRNEGYWFVGSYLIFFALQLLQELNMSGSRADMDDGKEIKYQL